MDVYSDWENIIEELDAYPALPEASADFIIDLVEKRPPYLSSKQVAWLKDLQ